MWTFEQNDAGFWIARHYQADPITGSLGLVFQGEPHLTKDGAETDALVFDCQVELAGEEVSLQ